MNGKYILNGHEAVLCTDLAEWGTWFETANRKVAETEIPDGRVVSTVFLGLDHNFGDGPPILFETMVFPADGSMLEEYCERYTTWEEAEAGHEAVVRKLTDGEAL